MLISRITDNPADDNNVRGDPFKTLIVARLSYEANEADLEKEFGRFGPIERVCSLFTMFLAVSSFSVTFSITDTETNAASDPHYHRYTCSRATQ